MDEQTMFTLMVDLHRDGERQGVGSDEETLRALKLTPLDRNAELEVGDIGCGTGAPTLALAAALPRARINAVDVFPEFLDILAAQAREAGAAERIETRAESMDALSFEVESLDLIWSEGAIYNMGFQAGIEVWKPFLRPGGVIGVSEITWLRLGPPREIRDHWDTEYPEIATAAEKINILERAGYRRERRRKVVSMLERLLHTGCCPTVALAAWRATLAVPGGAHELLSHLR